jgi:hypothetical protein
MGFGNAVNGYAQVSYDVHSIRWIKALNRNLSKSEIDGAIQAAYSAIYGKLFPVSISDSQSVRIIKREMIETVKLMEASINMDLETKGFPTMTFTVRKLDRDEDGAVFGAIKLSLEAQVVAVGETLAARIVKLESDLDGVTADVNALLRKGSLALSRARRDVETARAQAVAFGLTEDVQTAFDATSAIINAESRKRELVKATGAVLAVKAAAQGLELIEELDG